MNDQILDELNKWAEHYGVSSLSCKRWGGTWHAMAVVHDGPTINVEGPTPAAALSMLVIAVDEQHVEGPANLRTAN